MLAVASIGKDSMKLAVRSPSKLKSRPTLLAWWNDDATASTSMIRY